MHVEHDLPVTDIVITYQTMETKRRMADGLPNVEGRLTGPGTRRALNFIQDILRGRKDAVTFYQDKNGVLRELGTGKEIDVVYPNRGKERGGGS